MDTDRGAPHPAFSHVDSLALACSARYELSAPPNYFRRFPNGSSLPADAEKGRERRRSHIFRQQNRSGFKAV